MPEDFDNGRSFTGSNKFNKTPRTYGHWMNDPANRTFKRDSKSNRRKRPPGAPIYKKGQPVPTTPTSTKKGKKK
jgi:hypothetical protein